MKLIDEIRMYQVTSPLPASKIKTSREYFALAMFKFLFPEKFANLRKAESPDLQDCVAKLGIEVTSGISPQDEQITGESLKYSRAKSGRERNECLRIIQKCGGTRDAISTGYPVSTPNSDKGCVINVFQKKVKKADQYHKEFQHMGMAIIMDIPMFLFCDHDWGKWLEPMNEDQYEFVALIHWSGIDVYNFITKDYCIKRIKQEDMDALKKLGRLAAEERIRDDDPIWHKV